MTEYQQSKPWRRRAKVFFSCGSLLFALLVVEIGLRVFWPVRFRALPRAARDPVWKELLHRSSSVPGLSYEPTPNGKGEAMGVSISINSHGMRDDEPLPDGTVGLQRIAAVGDSYTYGHGVEQDETWPAVLERLLDERDPSVRSDVLNFGVVGYSTREEASVVKYKAMLWRPQTIVVGYVLNDPNIESWDRLHSNFEPVRWWRYSHVLRLLTLRWKLWQVSYHGRGDHFSYLHAVGRTPWESVKQGFVDIAQAHVRTIVVIFPMTPIGPSWDRYAYLPLHAQVAEAAEAAGLEVLDLFDLYSRHDPASLRVNELDPHPSAKAYRLSAEAIGEKLAR